MCPNDAARVVVVVGDDNSVNTSPNSNPSTVICSQYHVDRERGLNRVCRAVDALETAPNWTWPVVDAVTLM